MGWSEFIGSSLLAVSLVILATFTGVRQWSNLRDLRFRDELSREELNYRRGQARRRLWSAGLLLLLAVLLATIQTVLEKRRQEVIAERAVQLQSGESVPTSEPHRQFIRIYVGAWIALLVVLLAVVLLVGFDVWAIRRYALNQYRRLQADRRAMLERQVNRLRRESEDT